MLACLLARRTEMEQLVDGPVRLEAVLRAERSIAQAQLLASGTLELGRLGAVEARARLKVGGSHVVRRCCCCCWWAEREEKNSTRSC